MLTDEGAVICTVCYYAYKREGGRFGEGSNPDSRVTEILSGGGVGAHESDAAAEAVSSHMAEDDKRAEERVAGAADALQGGPAGGTPEEKA